MTARRDIRHLPHLWVVSVAVLVVATVAVIGLATPGPWHAVLPTARAGLVSKPPADLVVFLDGKGSPGPRSEMILWLHVDYERPALAVVVVPPEVLVDGSGRSTTPLAEVTERDGAAAGARALSGLLGARVGAWVIVDREALLASLGASSLGSQVLGGGMRLTEAVLRRQVSALRALVVLAPRRAIPVHAFENYVLASSKVSTSLGLNGAASLGKVLRDAARADVRVLALPAHADSGRWTPDAVGVRDLVRRLRDR